MDDTWAIIGISVFLLVLVLIIGLVVVIAFSLTRGSDLGQACTRSEDCQAGLSCVDSVCLLEIGQVCDRDADCASGHCNNGTCRRRGRTPARVAAPIVQAVRSAPTQAVSMPVSYVSPAPLVRSEPVRLRSLPTEDSLDSADERDDIAIMSDQTTDTEDEIDTRIRPRTAALRAEASLVRQVMGAEILDTTAYSSSSLQLLSDGTSILKKDPSIGSMMVSSNVQLTRLTAMGGYLYALSDGGLYRLRNDTWDRSHWQFDPVSGLDFGDGFEEMASPMDESILWLANSDYAYVLDAALKIVLRYRRRHMRVRVYGQTADTWIDFDPTTYQAIRSKDGKEHILASNVRAAALGVTGQLFTLDRNDRRGFNQIKIVNGIPYYYRRPG